MAKKKEIIVQEKRNKPLAVTLFDKMPDDLQTNVDDLVRNYTNTRDLALEVVELGKKYDFTIEELGVVIQYKLALAGIKSGSVFKQLAQIKGEPKEKKLTEEKTKDDAEDEAKSELEAAVGYIDINFDEVDKDKIIEQIKANKRARVYFSKDTNEFVKIEFMKK
jgi:hypothetical protein